LHTCEFGLYNSNMIGDGGGDDDDDDDFTQNLPGLPKTYPTYLKFTRVTQYFSDLSKTYHTYPELNDEAH